MEFLAQRAGIKNEQIVKSDHIPKLNKKLLYEMNKEAAKFFHNILLNDQNYCARKYLLNRGLNLPTIKKFGIGFAPNEKNKLLTFLKDKMYKNSDIILNNLAIINKFGQTVDKFRNRIIFPIINTDGYVVGFGGRTLGDNVPKYLNTSDTPIFKKSSNLFALNFAKRSTEKQLILTEGYMDVIALYRIGIKNVVATLGTALTIQQVKLISKHTREVVVCYDSDFAGQKAASRAIEILKNNNLSVKILKLPNAKDPDEFVKNQNGLNAVDEFKKLLTNSKNELDYKLTEIKNSFNLSCAEDKIKYLKKVIEIIARLNDFAEIQIHLNRISSELNLDKKMLTNDFKKIYSKKNKRDTEKKRLKKFDNFDFSITIENKNTIYVEFFLISCIINNIEYADEIFGRVDERLFLNNLTKKIYNNIVKSVKNVQNNLFENLTNELNFKEKDFFNKSISKIIHNCDFEKSVDDCINALNVEIQKENSEKLVNIDQDSVNEYIKKLRSTKK